MLMITCRSYGRLWDWVIVIADQYEVGWVEEEGGSGEMWKDRVERGCL
mgnify:CR=1 FL=1